MLVFRDDKGEIRQVTSGSDEKDIEVIKDQDKAKRLIKAAGMKVCSPILAIFKGDKID